MKNQPGCRRINLIGLFFDLTYHELAFKKEMLVDISSVLKKEGILVIAENMTKKLGKKKDCGHDMPVEKGLH